MAPLHVWETYILGYGIDRDSNTVAVAVESRAVVTVFISLLVAINIDSHESFE